jgi:hypothetical protein
MKRTKTIPKAGREVVLSAAKLNDAEIRLLVANYYMSQDMRKRADMQVRHLGDRSGTDYIPPLLQYLADSSATVELAVKNGIAKYADASIVGQWCQLQVGVGPIITAGLLAHIDISKAPTVGHIWSFAGLNPEMKWEKGKKRPYNAALKQVCFHLGECFKRTSGNPDSLYGRIYQTRKIMLIARNDEGYNAERAKSYRTQSAEVRKTLALGKLPAGNLDRQACNYAAKIFLSHLHAILFWDKYHKPPPKPFAISIMGHAHEIRIPDLDMFPGFSDAYYGASALDEAAE